jgi:hypothetical protein
MNASFLKE